MCLYSPDKAEHNKTWNNAIDEVISEMKKRQRKNGWLPDPFIFVDDLIAVGERLKRG